MCTESIIAISCNFRKVVDKSEMNCAIYQAVGNKLVISCNSMLKIMNSSFIVYMMTSICRRLIFSPSLVLIKYVLSSTHAARTHTFMLSTVWSVHRRCLTSLDCSLSGALL